jgi:hypothetical protein
MRINNPWILCSVGIFFCVMGIYLFFKTVYEEQQSVRWAVIVMIMGIILIAAGTATYFKLIN